MGVSLIWRLGAFVAAHLHCLQSHACYRFPLKLVALAFLLVELLMELNDYPYGVSVTPNRNTTHSMFSLQLFGMFAAPKLPAVLMAVPMATCMPIALPVAVFTRYPYVAGCGLLGPVGDISLFSAN